MVGLNSCHGTGLLGPPESDDLVGRVEPVCASLIGPARVGKLICVGYLWCHGVPDIADVTYSKTNAGFQLNVREESGSLLKFSGFRDAVRALLSA